MKQIQMVDLTTQYANIQEEIDSAINKVVHSGQFINGPQVSLFAENLATYTTATYAVPCANGTDALQIALMALGLKSGDEVIIPAFTYAAAVEVVALLGLVPVLVDVDPDTYNIDPAKIQEAITPNTRGIIPVHLFGQTCNMELINEISKNHDLFILEDNAQSIGSYYTFSDGKACQGGTIGTIGTISFFPTKNLGCYGDGGAMLTNDESLAKKLKMIASHGQSKKYHHEIVGCNSRLDALQAAILNVKIKYLDEYNARRQKAAMYYKSKLSDLKECIDIPVDVDYSTHVYHQFTIKVKNGKRNELQSFLKEKKIPTMIYYPIPLHKQDAFCDIVKISGDLNVTTTLCESVLSLPMHTELDMEQQDYIIHTIKAFFE